MLIPNNTYYYFINSTITQLPSDYCQNNENLVYSSHYEE
ncbi:hypothetical protein P344_03620 [Spiroplasma mirum ATCC 29335]|uniref:Uncharacterized protein n=1 Tax=Spiroplasma mirum ATCC 29335 TaxID=838561 RepID=W6AMW4_9MOLU|nr:hypothetical protein P344_03620 [Spiroplasma mirum ATCC 29335]AKM53136.1 hypothetical protein SATRI_v1c06700 [Spiroplasma atrichopogonis]